MTPNLLKVAMYTSRGVNTTTDCGTHWHEAKTSKKKKKGRRKRKQLEEKLHLLLIFSEENTKQVLSWREIWISVQYISVTSCSISTHTWGVSNMLMATRHYLTEKQNYPWTLLVSLLCYHFGQQNVGGVSAKVKQDSSLPEAGSPWERPALGSALARLAEKKKKKKTVVHRGGVIFTQLTVSCLSPV